MKFKVFDNKTGKEADPYEIALHEEWAQKLCYCDMDGFAILEDGSLLLVDECGNFVYCDTERFTVVFEDERPHGEWETAYLDHVSFGVRPKVIYCSECQMVVNHKENFCPNCGADMRSDEKR